MEKDPVEMLLSADMALAQIIRNVGNYSVEILDNPFESLIRSIIYQQFSGKSPNAIFRGLLVFMAIRFLLLIKSLILKIGILEKLDCHPRK